MNVNEHIKPRQPTLLVATSRFSWARAAGNCAATESTPVSAPGWNFSVPIECAGHEKRAAQAALFFSVDPTFASVEGLVTPGSGIGSGS